MAATRWLSGDWVASTRGVDESVGVGVRVRVARVREGRREGRRCKARGKARVCSILEV